LTVAFEGFEYAAQCIIAFSGAGRKKLIDGILAVHDILDKGKAIKMWRIKEIPVENDAFIYALDWSAVMHGFTVDKNNIALLRNI
jgi:hypothetical protein